MQFYSIAEGIYKAAAAPFMEQKEILKASMPLQYQDKLYREIIFLKPSLTRGFEVRGYLYATEEGEVIKSENLKKKIAALGHKGSSLLDEEATAKMKRTMMSEKDIAKERAHFGEMVMALNVLKSEGTRGTEVVEPILAKLTDYKVENNEALKAVIDRVEGLDDKIVTEERLEEINSLYEKSLMINFRRIIHMLEGLEYYEDIKAGAARKNRFRFFTFNGDLTGRFAKLEQGMAHMKKILNMYEPVLNLTEEEYKKFLANIDRERIEERVEMCRA